MFSFFDYRQWSQDAGNSQDPALKKYDDDEFSDDDAQIMMKEKIDHVTSSRSSVPASLGDFSERYSKTLSVNTRSPAKESVHKERGNPNANLLFYQNDLKTHPGVGYSIEEILKWHGDYEMLEKNSYCIQWLFPTSSYSSANPEVQPLQDHEAIAISNNPVLQNRAFQAFAMMLDHYGMKAVFHQDGSMKVERSSNWEERYQNLNNSKHDLRKITRILSFLGALGFGQYQHVWLRFLIVEAVHNKTLENLNGENILYWINTLENDNCKGEMLEFHNHLKMQNTTAQMTLTLPLSSHLGHELEHDSDCKENGMEVDNDLQNDNIVNLSEKGCVFMDTGCVNSQHYLENMPNVKFYLNKIKSMPDPGFYLEELKQERPEFALMKKMHNHIQWLFPNPNQSGVNPYSKPLTETEAMVFQSVKELRECFLEVYRLILACYGLDIVSMDTGEIQKVDGWEERFNEINKLTSLPRIITRILTSLAVLGLGYCQVPLVYFLLNEAMMEKSLPNLDGSHVEYWIGVIEGNEERQMITDAWVTLKSNQQRPVPRDWNLPHIVRSEGVKQDSNDRVANDIGKTDLSLPLMGRTDGERQVGADKVASDIRKSDLSLPHVREDSANQGSVGTGKRSSLVNKEKSRFGGVKKFLGNILCGIKAKGSVDRMTERQYEKERVSLKLSANVEFYNNEKKSSYFWGHSIEDMLQWKGDYYKLEMNHQYIQWLFPIPEGSGVNPNAQALQPHEAETIKNSTILRRRVLRSYEMMLDFYGMKLVSEESTEVQRSDNWRERYQHLNRSGHNHLRITRIIKSIGLLGLQNYQLPWVKFILHEIFEASVLPRLGGRQVMYWIEAIADEKEREEAYVTYVTLKGKR